MLKSKKILALLLVLSIVSLFSVSTFAMPGGMPAAHEMTGREFGEAVSTLAKSEPGAVAAHIAEMHVMYPDLDDEEIEEEEIELEEEEIEEEIEKEVEETVSLGKPAAHGMTGREFGKAVSTMARSTPGAVAAHVRMPM